jgi:hypothetical protein
MILQIIFNVILILCLIELYNFRYFDENLFEDFLEGLINIILWIIMGLII